MVFDISKRGPKPPTASDTTALKGNIDSLKIGVAMCEVCHGESGGVEVGVACIPGVPMSISWCDECLKHEAFPSFVFDHDWIFVACGHPEALNDWAKERVCWADGKYVPFLEYVKRITSEQIERENKEYDDYTNTV